MLSSLALPLALLVARSAALITYTRGQLVINVNGVDKGCLAYDGHWLSSGCNAFIQQYNDEDPNMADGSFFFRTDVTGLCTMLDSHIFCDPDRVGTGAEFAPTYFRFAGTAIANPNDGNTDWYVTGTEPANQVLSVANDGTPQWVYVDWRPDADQGDDENYY